jgi:bacterioferritin-associated ferredoxin
MIVCSCNKIDTAKIREALKYIHEPNERLVLNMMGWEPECSQCTKVLTEEIRRLMVEINTLSLTEGEDNGC